MDTGFSMAMIGWMRLRMGPRRLSSTKNPENGRESLFAYGLPAVATYHAIRRQISVGGAEAIPRPGLHLCFRHPPGAEVMRVY